MSSAKRKRRDPHAPKPCKNAYLHFSTEKRNEILRENPDIDCQELSREVGRIWKAMTQSERKPWNDLAGHDRARYEAEMKNFTNPLLREAMGYESDESAIIASRKIKDRNAPKQPKTAYIHFWTEKRDNVIKAQPGINFQDVAREVGRMWRELTPELRQPWLDAAANDKLRYQTELEAYNPPPVTNQPVKAKKRRKDPNAPKPPKSGFMYLLEHKKDELMALNPDMTFNSLSQEVGKMWRAMTDAEKQPWLVLSQADKKRYEMELQHYKVPKYLSDIPDKRMLIPSHKNDPKAPKQPKGPFVFFSAQKRDEIQAEFPNLPYGDVMKKIGAAWKAMSTEERKPWRDLSEVDKLRYDTELKQYIPQHRAKLQGKMDGNDEKRRKKDPHAPKPPKTAFVHFQLAKRDEVMSTNKLMTYNEYAQEIGKIWRGMTDEEKQCWKELAMDDKARYEAEMINYKPVPYLSDSDTEIKGKGKKRDPSLPAAPKNAYQYLFASKRDEVMNSKPGMSYNDCASTIGKMWRGMSAEERQPYVNLAAQDKARYESELHAMRAKKYEMKKKKLAKKDPHAPKSAKSAFMFVLEAKKEEVLREKPGLTYNQIAQEVGKIWHSMSETDKQPWRDLAAEDKARYDAEMEAYEPSVDSMRITEPKKKKKKKDPNAPKPAKSAFLFFSAAKREEIAIQNPELPFADTMKRIGKMWSALDAEGKREWEERAKVDKTRFEKELQIYSGTQGQKDAFV